MQYKNSLTMQGIAMLLMLLLQYFLGMYTNLYVQFPNGQHGDILWEFAWKQLPLVLHIILGILLIVNAIILIIRSFLQKNKTWIKASIIGYVGIQIAALSGAAFIPTQVAIYSFSMSLCFLLALLAYGYGIYASKVK